MAQSPRSDPPLPSTATDDEAAEYGVRRILRYRPKIWTTLRLSDVPARDYRAVALDTEARLFPHAVKLGRRRRASAAT